MSNLVEAGALPSSTDSDDERAMDSFNVDSTAFLILQFPSLDSMPSDCSVGASDDDEFKAMSAERATQLLEYAVDLNAMRDELRGDIATLNEEMSKEREVFAAIPDAVCKIVEAMTNDRLFDCWAVK